MTWSRLSLGQLCPLACPLTTGASFCRLSRSLESIITAHADGPPVAIVSVADLTQKTVVLIRQLCQAITSSGGSLYNCTTTDKVLYPSLPTQASHTGATTYQAPTEDSTFVEELEDKGEVPDR
ncbi:hypothetical protein OF83DRAFT_294812 [Amylostereum chailletii]|nr:hypothetical protein OF83DRAFT_294812 [Amylostereum chailletii]